MITPDKNAKDIAEETMIRAQAAVEARREALAVKETARAEAKAVWKSAYDAAAAVWAKVDAADARASEAERVSRDAWAAWGEAHHVAAGSARTEEEAE